MRISSTLLWIVIAGVGCIAIEDTGTETGGTGGAPRQANGIIIDQVAIDTDTYDDCMQFCTDEPSECDALCSGD